MTNDSISDSIISLESQPAPMAELFRRSWIWLLIFIAGSALGIVTLDSSRKLLSQAMQTMKNMADGKQGPYFWLIIILKNSLVVVISILFGRVTRGVLPGMICLFNGYILGLLAVYLETSHIMPYWKLALSIMPHGIIELPAIFLACAIGVQKVPLAARFRQSLLPIGMLVVAAAIETWISPLIMIL